MKKIYSIVMSLCAVLAITSCVNEKLAVFNPAETQTQVLGPVTGTTLSADGADLTFTFNQAAFSVTSPVGYTLYVAASGSQEGSKLSATITADTDSDEGTITVKQKDLNSAMLNLGAVADSDFALDFWLVGYLCNDKGATISGSEVTSEIRTATFVAYNADLNDVDIYEHVWIIGSGASVGGWNHDNVYQYLYNYSKDGATFEGLIDYGDNAADGWKLTGIAGWDDSCNWGSEAQAEDSEASSITLVSGGGSKDIKNYSKRFYKWSFNTTSLVLTKVLSFNNVGIVGDFNSWNAADANLKMEFNGAKHRFYIDYTFDTDAQLKFTCDDAWDLNWGVDCAQGGDNIAVTAGSYRIYLDLNSMEYSFNSSMYGKEEPGLSNGSDTVQEVWSIIGTVNGSSWDTDLDLTEATSGVWKYNGLTLTETDEFKLRYAHSWTTSVGGPEANASSNIDASNPYDVYKPVIGTAFKVGDKNIAVQAAGTYDLVYDTTADEITITEHASGWSLIGEIAGTSWSDDFDMTEQTGGIWVSNAVKIDGGFKLRFNKDWGVNRGGNLVALDTPFAVVSDGANISVPVTGDTYVVTYYAQAEAVSVHSVTTGWSIIGAVNGGNWDLDVYMTEVKSGVWSATAHVEGEIKIRFAGGWDVNRGGSFAALDTPFSGVQGGDNIKLDAGYYTVTYDATNDQITISNAWSLIGGVFGTEWGADFWMTADGNGGYVCPAAVLNGSWKIRRDGGWDVNRGGVFAALDTPFTAEAGGSDIASPGDGLYKVVYTPATEQISVSKVL